MYTIRIADLRARFACELEERIDDLTATLGRTPADDEDISLDVWWNLGSTSDADMVWSLRCVRGPDIEKHSRLFAVWCARQVLPFSLAKDRSTLESTLRIAERYAHGEATTEELRNARAAAAAAATAADAAAADAAYAAYAAAAADDADDADDARSKQAAHLRSIFLVEQS